MALRYPQQRPFTLAYGDTKDISVSGMSAQYIAVDNPGSYWVHFPQVAGALAWVPPTTFGAIVPAPGILTGMIRVTTVDVPAAYTLNTANLTAGVSGTVYEEFPQVSLGVQQVISTNLAAPNQIPIPISLTLTNSGTWYPLIAPAANVQISLFVVGLLSFFVTGNEVISVGHGPSAVTVTIMAVMGTAANAGSYTPGPGPLPFNGAPLPRGDGLYISSSFLNGDIARGYISFSLT